MVYRVELTGEHGYIGEKYTKDDKPKKPNKNDTRYVTGFGRNRTFDDEKFQSDMKRYECELEFYNKHKNQYKVECSTSLIGRKFKFVDNKINIIFGPNCSGKTTLIKCIAAKALCEDGFSNFIEPVRLKIPMSEERTYSGYKKALFNVILSLAGTSSNVEWDGSPIYYHNFINRKNYGSLGDLTGSIISSLSEEISYIMNSDKISSGQNTFYQINKLAQIMSKNMTYDDILAPYKKRYGGNGVNECWQTVYKVQEDYFKSFPMAFNTAGKNTYLFDEIDRAMDIVNTNILYTVVLPNIMKKYNKQIIVISHSPIVLTDAVYKGDDYNFISMDEEYTTKCRKIFT
ncbi:AAA family ATPase [uncultured Methanobrevibacter sp.]|uniref:AAA family ATPase n=1 Tax=uncultured Methanobrevibacter sp. TaxID=253161 RepID=UPI0025EE5BE9|nr:AAA family ATPase [uncultured Methanobrevibacter sp.]